MPYLVIVESPSKCAKIAQYLNNNDNNNPETMGAEVIATKGHLYKIKSLKDINMKNGQFAITYSILEDKAKYVVEMRKKIKKGKYDKIVLATDDDREGEFIAWSICDIFKLPVATTPRIIFHEITKPAIIRAMCEPTVINTPLVEAQQCRTVLDLLIGFKVSPILWTTIPKPCTSSEPLSAGRCQSPALRLIYDAHVIWQSELPRPEYVTNAIFLEPPLQFTLSPPLAMEPPGEATALTSFITNEIEASHNLTVGATTESINKPPSPLNTSALLQQASLTLKMGPKQTMQLAQQLYQDGHITYMRTESTTLSQQFKEQARQFIAQHYGPDFVDQPATSTIISATNMPHEAIRCTHLETNGDLGTNDGKNRLYHLIWKHSLYQLMPSARTNVTKMEITTHTNKHKWTAHIETPIFPGWKILDNHHASKPTTTAEHYRKPQTKPLMPDKIEISNTVKAKINNHYTESGIIKKLEEMGIGRPSTYHSIVETLKDRQYVTVGNIEGTPYDSTTYTYSNTSATPTIKTTTNVKMMGEEKNKLIITPLGLSTIEFLVKHFDSLFNYDYTAKMELILDKIASSTNDNLVPLTKGGVINQRAICNDCLTEIKTCIANIGKPAPLAVSEMGLPIEETNEPNGIKPSFKLDNFAKGVLLGHYEEKPVYKKVGRYGPYIQWADKNIAIKHQSIDGLKLEDVIRLLTSPSPSPVADLLPENKKILRNISEDISIRKGKYGKPYVYYSKTDMAKKAKKVEPVFISLSGTEKMWWKTCSNVEFMEWFVKNK